MAQHSVHRQPHGCRTNVRTFVIWSSVGAGVFFLTTSGYFIHLQIGISWSEVVAYARALPLMMFYWWVKNIPVPFISEGYSIVQLLGLDNVPVRDWTAFNWAMAAAQALCCLVPVNLMLGIWLVITRRQRNP